MSLNKFPRLEKTDLKTLNTALLFFHVSELKELALNLGLPDDGKKGAIIDRILYFIETDAIKHSPKIPAISRAQRGKKYPLQATTLILKGSYKNDLATRKFFKTLIGEHFHYTAYGIDWINEHWLAGNPPTYQEFANFWQQEYERRKIVKAQPKQEWAYINFTQKFLERDPRSSKEAILEAWERERSKQVNIAQKILSKINFN